MNFLKKLTRPWLFLSPEKAHELSPQGLKVFSQLWGSDDLSIWSPFSFRTLAFPNRIGLAGGVDKNGEQCLDWQRLGCGFVEVGTVTPQPQQANDGIILNRDLRTYSVWNKMGFPSLGAETVLKNLQSLKPHLQVPLFVNIGKNRTTANEQASFDYCHLLEMFSQLADAFVVNISSPNTKGLRDLAQPQNLKSFLAPITKKHHELQLTQPLLLKLSPDLPENDLINVVQTALESNFAGFILTNTTLDRAATPFYPAEGGVSGKPLQNLSKSALKTVRRLLDEQKDKKILISVGGVMTAEDVFERIELGADLVQVYSTLIFEGPLFFRKVTQLAKQRIQSTI